MMRYVAGTNEPVYPIGYTQHKNPLFRKKTWNYYTPEGREGIHNNLRINMAILLSLMRKPPYGYSAEYADNRMAILIRRLFVRNAFPPLWSVVIPCFFTE